MTPVRERRRAPPDGRIGTDPHVTGTAPGSVTLVTRNIYAPVSGCSDVYHCCVMSVQTDVTVEVETMVRALADPLRWRIVGLLARQRLCTCHLVELTGARQTNISNHLRVLRAAGVVAAEPAGRFTYYRLLSEPLEQVARHFDTLAQQAATTGTIKKDCP